MRQLMLFLNNCVTTVTSVRLGTSIKHGVPVCRICVCNGWGFCLKLQISCLSFRVQMWPEKALASKAFIRPVVTCHNFANRKTRYFVADTRQQCHQVCSDCIDCTICIIIFLGFLMPQLVCIKARNFGDMLVTLII